MSSTRIAEALNRQFEERRIVFWYDTNQEFRHAFDTLNLPGVEKIELVNNEFGVKHRILRREPEQRFLLYRHGPEPAHLDNWLLDVQLANGEPFQTDLTAIWRTELGLPAAALPVLEQHRPFFEAASRREKFARLVGEDDSHQQLRLKLLAVCCNADRPEAGAVLESLLAEYAADDDSRLQLVDRCNLTDFLWDTLGRYYGYRSDTPGLHDFILKLFSESFSLQAGLPSATGLSSEAQVFMQRWQDSREQGPVFATLSARVAETLQIAEKLEQVDYRQLAHAYVFELTDRKILTELALAVASRTVPARDVEQWLRDRRRGYWFDRYEHVYQALSFAAQFLQELELSEFRPASLSDGVRSYARSWFRFDQLYRKFIFHSTQSGQASLLQQLNDEVENRYSNHYLLRLSNAWQERLDAATTWEADPVIPQQQFFSRFVQPFLDRNNKACVIISDALRYELGEELHDLVRQEDRFDAELEPLLGVLPSYTQLGMAALLPHRTLALAGNGDVAVDGLSAMGTENREKILREHVPSAAAVQARDLLGMSGQETRALVRDTDVLYVYHDLIDQTGDRRDSEERVFAAAEEALQELLRLIRKLGSSNVNNMLLTADHGFIYQHRPIAESDYSTSSPAGAEVLSIGRRYVLGRGLTEQQGFMHFTAGQLGLGGDIEIQIPRSIGRIRRKGSGSRYVHGGATLQETVLPLLRIRKKRQSDTAQVTVELIGSGSRTITTGQLAITLYQTEPVTPKVQERRLRAGLYTLDGESISEEHDLTFDFTSDNPRERELTGSFVLSRQVSELNGQQVELRLREPVPGTSHFRDYHSVRYTVRIAFSSDFDL